MADTERTVMDLPLDELRARTDQAVEIIRALRELVAQHDVEHDALASDVKDNTPEELPPDLTAHVQSRVADVQALLPGVVQLVVDRRDELETWRANLTVMRKALDGREELAPAPALVEVERGALVLRACDMIADFLDEIHAAVYRSMGIRRMPTSAGEGEGA